MRRNELCLCEFPKDLQFRVCLFVVRCKLLESALVLVMVVSGNHLIISDCEYVTAPLVIIPLYET
jgi:hypothetical protein